MGNGQGINSKLEALRKREAALKAAIVAEQVRQQKRNEKDNARLFAMIGEALVIYGNQSTDFKTMLRQVLASAITDERSRQFLKDRGWI
jgi:hypothetical protein